MRVKLGEVFIFYAFVLLATSSQANLAWPEGQYCLPMAENERCPVGWDSGYRLHDTENNVTKDSRNHRGEEVPYVFNFPQDLGWGFCCKSRIRYSTTSISWPRGNYCIFRKGGFCPTEFREGTIFWDDEDSSNNNHASGTLPDGVYTTNTQIYFCCRNDGVNVNTLLGLPSCHSLTLMRYKAPCPIVDGYLGPYNGYLDWNTEDRGNNDQRVQAHPDGVSDFPSGIKVRFCSYRSPFPC